MVDSSAIYRMGCLLGLVAFVAGCGSAVPDPVAGSGAVAWRKALGGDAKGAGAAKVEEKKAEILPNDGHANLTGVFRFGGDAPMRPALSIGKDTAVCTPGGKQILSEDIVVDPASKGIANCLIFVDKAPDSWIHESAKTAPAEEAVFDQKECVFLSHTFAFQTGQKIRIKNSDPILHNAAATPAGNPPFNEGIPAGAATLYSAAKETAAPFQVKCTIHEWMSAWMIVRGNGYVSVSKPNGEFEMKNVPAGVDVTFRIWQEKSGFVSKPGVKLNGQELKLKGGRFTFKLDKGDAAKNKMELELPASVFQ